MNEILKWCAGVRANRVRIDRARQRSSATRFARQRRRRGLTAIEYCFMLSLVMLAVLFAVQHLGSTLKASFQASDAKMQSYMPAQ